MRDLVVTLVVFIGLPMILKYPYLGVLFWSWIGYMNPHRLSWGFARDFPFAMLIALVTLVALLISKESKKIHWDRATITLVIFILWMLVTTIWSYYPQLAWLQFEKVVKIQVMTFVTLMIMKDRWRLEMLVLVIVVSLGLYGVKGGIFTVLTGGGYHVFGPAGTFIGGNNEIGLALIMTLPLMRYLQMRARNPWLFWVWVGAMGTTVIAILGTQSRGALVGIVAMTFFLILKSRRRMLLLTMVTLMVPLTFTLMPQTWFDRMSTIETYEQDASAQGRLRAWSYAIDIANQHPFTGGGYEIFAGRTDAHSIYFEVLGEHGYVGLALFLLIGWFSWRNGSWVLKHTRRHTEMGWLRDLASMLQVSLVGYAAAGAFLGLAYFDFYYHIVAMMALTRWITARTIAEQAGEQEHDGEIATEAVRSVGRQPWFTRSG